MRGTHEKWWPGRVVKVLGTRTYVVSVGGKLRYVHVDHMIDAPDLYGDDSRVEPQKTSALMDDEITIPKTIPTPAVGTLPPEISPKPTAPKPTMPKPALPNPILPKPATPAVASPKKNSSPQKSVTPAKVPERRYPLRDRKPRQIIDM